MPPIESISGIWRFTRPPGYHIHTHSLPDHLLQLVLKGSYAIRTNNRQYRVNAGDLIYFYAYEDIQWLSNRQEVSFYSVGFRSVNFKPIPFDRRVFLSTNRIKKAFDRPYRASTIHRDSIDFSLKTHAALLDILSDMQTRFKLGEYPKSKLQIWWQLEKHIRREHHFRASLEELAEWSTISRTSLVRLCRQATGTSPMKRIRQIRLEEAKGLLLCSALNITEIARYLCYSRMHEFSREFSAYYGISPSRLRKLGTSE